MLKISKKNEAKLDCICGMCEHDCLNKTCLFNKILDAPHPEEVQKKYIISLMEDVFNENAPFTAKTIKTTRAKINTKKGK